MFVCNENNFGLDWLYKISPTKSVGKHISWTLAENIIVHMDKWKRASYFTYVTMLYEQKKTCFEQ